MDNELNPYTNYIYFLLIRLIEIQNFPFYMRKYLYHSGDKVVLHCILYPSFYEILCAAPKSSDALHFVLL